MQSTAFITSERPVWRFGRLIRKQQNRYFRTHTERCMASKEEIELEVNVSFEEEGEYKANSHAGLLFSLSTLQ